MTTSTPTLTVHHLNASSSERIPWLCEELNILYTLRIYPRDPITKLAPPEYKALHPGGSAPVINDQFITTPDTTSNPSQTQSQTDPESQSRVITLAESGACVQYICAKYAPQNSTIFPSPDSPCYPTFLFWFHWSNATFQAALTRSLSLRNSGVDTKSSKMAQITANRVQKCLDMLEEQLTPVQNGDSTGTGDENGDDDQWLIGKGIFTAADIMLVFSLTTFRYWYPYSLAGHPNILAYLGRIGQREAYQRAMKKADPDLGMDLVLRLGGEPPKGLW